MSQQAARVSCPICGYSSDPGSLLCALCGSFVRKRSGQTTCAPTCAPHQPATGQGPLPEPPAELLSPSPAPARCCPPGGATLLPPVDAPAHSWIWTGICTAALAVLAGLLCLALNPALLSARMLP